MHTQTKQYKTNETLETLKKLTQRKINLYALWNGVILELRKYVDWLDCTNVDITLKADPSYFFLKADMAKDLKALGEELNRIGLEYEKTEEEFTELADKYYGTQQTTEE